MIRLRVSISQVEGVWGSDVTVVIAGLTNTYSSYVTTFEEYAMQRYEGASTIFGPHTLDAYIQVGKSHLCKGALVGCRACMALNYQSSLLGHIRRKYVQVMPFIYWKCIGRSFSVR